MEGGNERSTFAVSAFPDPTNYTAWEFLDASVYVTPAGRAYGPCPSIRYDPTTGYYYVVTGGNEIAVLRSFDLANWEVSETCVGPPVNAGARTRDCLCACEWGRWVVGSSSKRVCVLAVGCMREPAACLHVFAGAGASARWAARPS
jgi:hypothetical protein